MIKKYTKGIVMSVVEKIKGLVGPKRKLLLYLIDTVCFAAVFCVAVLITMNMDTGHLVSDVRKTVINAIIFFLCLTISRFAFKTYRYIWRYANFQEYIMMMVSDMTGGCIAFCISWFSNAYIGAWLNVSIVSLFCLSTIFTRLLYQCMYRRSNLHQSDYIENERHKIGVAIVGAGQIGVLLADELLCNVRSHYKPLLFIDSSKDKIGAEISGLKVYAESEKTVEMLKSMPVQEIFVAIPNISNESAREKYELYSSIGCKVKLYDFPLNDKKNSSGKRVLREFHIEDLLFRSVVSINNDRTMDFYRDKVVMVTGGGGSIGSELCRQIAKAFPKKLIILDIYENNAYAIQQELKIEYGDSLDLEVEIASVRDRVRIDSIFAEYHPDIVFHAAAHKHVPLMEHSACEAIKNNVLGTYNVADMAEKHGVGKFILISTDKAVNPTNVMGASKRMCEMIIQCRTDSKTSFAAVRFGNVLGSNGSVIPLFKKQIENGGPITITDKRIIRYFMTIPEASQLVLEAGAFAEKGELFVLDMGKPIKILELAENMIRLSGYEPYKDIDIVEMGLRPGEKLYEELLVRGENLGKTANELIFTETDTSLTTEELEERLECLRRAVDTGDDDTVKEALHKVVPTFRSPEEINADADESKEMAEALV